MPSITYNGQSFAVDGRRLWLLGASLQYARIPAPLWAQRIDAARQAGFNTIETACPWVFHEPRRGRFIFQGDADLRKFIQTCAAAGMKVILRAGPYIGSQFDGGGLPGWLAETPGVRLRENNDVFLEHVSRYFRKLLGEIADLQITDGGPILLIQSEHAWTCSNEDQAEKYLHEVTRFIRESGITIPITNANDLWQESPGTIDTWRGYDDLLVHLRQLRSVQPSAPRLVSAFEAAGFEVWGEALRGKAAWGARGKSERKASAGATHLDGQFNSFANRTAKSSHAVLRRLAEILASGGQPIVSPFHGGTNFGFLAGRVAGGHGGFVTTRAAADAPLGEAGTRGKTYHAIRRLVTFASHFSHVFAELDPDYQPIVLDPEPRMGESSDGVPTPGVPASGISGLAGVHGAHAAASSGGSGGAGGSGGISVVPLRGPQGRIVFVFGPLNANQVTTTLVLDDGIRLPVNLGDQSVGWYALNIDLGGSGRLDYASVCPWAIVDRTIVVFQGPAKATAFLSISGTPLEAVIPAEGAKPLVIDHRGLTLVICNQTQIDATYHDDKTVYVGVNGFDSQGAPLPLDGFGKAWVVRKDAKLENLDFGGLKGKSNAPKSKTGRRQARNGSIELKQWQAAPATDYVTGNSPRYASLEGPEKLSECGAPSGYGWYRVNISAGGRKLCHIPHASDRLHLFVDGEFQQLFGVGPGADPDAFELRFTKGDQALVALVDNFGRFADGNDLGQPKGWYGHMYEVKALRAVKPKIAAAKPVDPFALRGFIWGRAAGQLSDTQQAIWTFAHSRKTPIVIDINGARPSGTLVLNDEPVAYYSGATGACLDRIVLDSQTHTSFKRGKNVLRFAPDLRQEGAAQEVASATTLYECVEALTESALWAFAKWDPPPASAYANAGKPELKSIKGRPCWWRTTFHAPAGSTAGSTPGSDSGNPHESQGDDATGSHSMWFDTAGLSKGQIYLNGQNLGRYFTATADGKHVGPQTRLYVPTCWLKPGQTNELVLFDEHGFDPLGARLLQGADGDDEDRTD